jgi:HTH-type transcriptional regulator/antitoxin HigA
MPTAYDELLLEASPQVIGNSQQYDSVMSRVGVLIRKGRNRTPEETKLMRLLSVLIQDYDRKHAIPSEESTPAERLRYLLEVSHKTPADLISIFGQRSHVSEALNGKRRISAAQTHKLAEMFRLKPGYFL